MANAQTLEHRPAQRMRRGRTDEPRSFALWQSPRGWIAAVRSPRGLLALTLPDDDPAALRARLFEEHGPALHEEPAAFAAFFDKLTRYWHGEPVVFDEPLAPEGTDFQQSVWNALLQIPSGETLSYGELARRLGRPTSARAVGQAVGANPIAIIIPCHRVLGSDGRLHGYAGGLEMKRQLLALEGVIVDA